MGFPEILHQRAVQKVVSDVIQREAIPCEIIDFDPRGYSWTGGIYAPSNVSSGWLAVRVTGPDKTTYDITLQAADLLDASLVMSQFDIVLPEFGLFDFWPANGDAPNDGQISVMASGSWANKSNVLIEAVTSTLDVGVMGENVGVYTNTFGAEDYNSEDGTFVNFNGTLFVRDNGVWVKLGANFVSPLGITIGAGDNTPDQQLISMIPIWHTVGFNVSNNKKGVSASLYIAAPDSNGASLQFTSNSPDVGQGSILFEAGTIDPSVGDGLAVAFGTLYCRNIDGSSAELWFHQGPLDTDWTRIVPPPA